MADYFSGKITYHTQPPEDKSVVSATIATELGEAFDINAKTFGGINMILFVLFCIFFAHIRGDEVTKIGL